MGFRLKIEGESETIELGMENINDVTYRSDTPDDSDARATDLATELVVSGKILAAVDGEPDHTKKLAIWSLVNAESSDAYRNMVLEVIAGDQVVRKLTFPNSFIVDYTEEFGHTEGVGTFILVLRQKKDKLIDVAIDGNYAK
ncbi:MAG: membrane-associated protease 1 [Bacillota bacterium]